MNRHLKLAMAAVLIAAVSNRTPAQQLSSTAPSFGSANGPNNQAVPSGYETAGSPVDPLREIEDLRRRLEKCEAELHDRATTGAPREAAINPVDYPSNLQSPPTKLLNPGIAPANPASEQGDPTAVPIITSPTLQIGGKAIWDNAMFSQDPANRKLVGTEPNLTGFRFLRLMFYGDLYENINYRLEVDMAQAQSSTNPALLAAFQDVWVNFRELPVLGHVKVGYFKEPYGLEQQTGEEYLLFMERSLPNAFVPARHMGVMAYNDLNDKQTLSWFTGAFREGSGDKTFLEYSNEGDWGTTTRLIWLPYYDAASGGRYLAHIGGAYEFTGTNNNNADSKAFTLVPEINAQTPFSVATIPSNDFQLYSVEAAIMNGPLLIESEYMGALLTPLKRGQDIYLDGGYVEALYLLTGENHNYNLPGKFFQGVTPYEPFFRVRNPDGEVITGWGAWEIGARLSFIDLNNDGVGGGRAVNYTFGLHWYLTNNCSVMYNFIHSNFEKVLAKKDIDSTCDINGIRVEYHF
ncbi:MAG TPA: porin [Pirellulales bacterium]|jgi:phosphate-selective porin OprO/OprP|nr:porin [Pirellulales bacterium]